MGAQTTDTVIEVRNLVYRYRREDPIPVLDHIDLNISRTDYLLVAGRSGSGKSTLCRTFNGLIPHFHGGILDGEVFVDGQAVSQTPISQLFSHVGMVFQNPDAQLFCRSVEKEIVFGLESLGLDRETIEARLSAALDRAGIGDLRSRDPQRLSGGEKHLVLIAAMLALRPAVIVLDEPFANLDPANVRRVRRLLRDLHAGGTGVVLCEHRLSRAAPDAGRVVVLDRGRVVADGPVQDVLTRADPRWGLEPPLAIRIAAAVKLPAGHRTLADIGQCPPRPDLIRRLEPKPPRIAVDRDVPPVLSVDGVHGRQGGRTVLSDIGFSLHAGECVAIVGANGAGKTTLLRHLMGLQRPTAGTIRLHDHDTRRMTVAALARDVGLAFQNPDNQFFKPTVAREIRVGPETLGVRNDGWLDELMACFHLDPLRQKAPFRLSGGEKKRVAFAAALAAKPAILALDEPTAGQDFVFRRNLRDLLARLQAGGQTIVIVTHDLTFAERTARRWLLLAGGRLLADDAPERIMADADLMARAGLEPTERFQLMRMWSHA